MRCSGGSAVVLTISHKLSGTYQSACIAAEGRERIFVVDTMSASIGSGILARYAIDNAHLHAGELAALLERRRQDVCIIGLVDTLEYLKKGGRITPAAAALGTLLKLKPVLQIQGEKLDAFAKARTVKQAKTIMTEAMKNDFEKRFHSPNGEKMNLELAYTFDTAAAEAFKEEVQAVFPDNEIVMQPLSLSIACHIGPGALAIACSKKIEA